MRKEYDLLIVGATALAAGFVAAHPELSVVILEESFNIAGEFCNTWRVSATPYAPVTSAGKGLAQQLKSRNAEAWLPAVQPVVAQLLQASAADVYFFGAITGLERTGDGCRVTWNAYGLSHSFTVKAVMDTTVNFITAPMWGLPQPECSMELHHVDADHKIHATPCRNLAEGRETIIRNNQNILLIATQPVLLPPERSQTYGGLSWLPSGAYRDFPEAFDAGAMAVIPEGALPETCQPAIDTGSYDVIVVGLGTAGVMATITAQAEGLSVLGIEKLPVCGGTGTAGRVTGYYFGYHGGRYVQLDEAAHQFDGSFLPMSRLGADQKIAQIDRALAGCDIRTNATFTEALVDGQTVTGIRWLEKGICHTAKARYVIDATAEAAVCVSAGCNMLGGRQSDGQFQPYTLVHLKHIDGKLSWGNMDQGRVDQYDPDSLSRELLGSFTSAIHLRQDYSDRTYMGIVPLLGLREGMRIAGEETVAFHDLIHGNFCQKPAYYCWSNFDNHGKDMALESRDYQDWAVLAGLWGWGLSIPIPMGAMIPKGFQGLLAAGRCISVDHDTAFAVRMRDDTSKSGEAAAQLVALSLRSGVLAKEIDPEALRQKLFETGCLKPEDETPRLEKQRMGLLYEGQLWCSDTNAITEMLASDAPGYGIWSAKLLGQEDYLLPLLASTDKNTCYHAALALALLGDSSAATIEVLCRCALDADGFMPTSGRKYVHPRSVSAIYALGRIGSPLALPTLWQLLESDRQIPFTPDQLLKDAEDLRFQYRSHAFAALCAIGKADPAIRDQLVSYLDANRFSVSLIGGPLRAEYKESFRKLLEVS